MKILKLLLLLTLCTPFLGKANSEWGPADTIVCYNVGPGIEYTKIIYHNKPLIIWYTTIDLTNPHNQVEEVFSRNQVPDPLRWDIAEHYKGNSRPGHQVKVAWNHDFFNYEAGTCIGINISDGQVGYTPWGRSILAITKDKKAEIFAPNFKGQVITADKTVVDIDMFNSSAVYLNGSCIFFNHLNGLQLTAAGKYIKVKPLAKWVVNGPNIPCEILEISDQPLQTSATECVIFLRETKLNALDGHIKVGEKLEISQKFEASAWGNIPQNIVQGFHGYPSITHDGVLHEGEYNNFENGREFENSSHVMAGISKDKTRLYICLNEMSAQSTPINCVEMANWMLERGAWDIVNFDSGGSAAIAVNEKMLNLPGRGSVRPVQDAMIAVSLAPESKEIDHLSFTKPYISPSTISLTPLSVISYNQYGDIIEENVKDCSYTVVPSELGFVDAEGIFHSSSKGGIGKIIAEKEGKKGEMQITVNIAQDVKTSYSNLIIDSTRKFPIPIQGTINTVIYQLDPSAFNWQIENPTIASIENGMLIGLQNGETKITGTFENLSLSLNVKVEIGIDQQTLFDFNDIKEATDFSLKGVTNLTFKNTLPEDWREGTTLHAEKISGRLKSLSAKLNKTTYGIPDALALPIANENNVINRITLACYDNLGERHLIEIKPKAVNKTYIIDLKNKDGNLFDIPQFPIKVMDLNIYFNNAQDKEFSIGHLYMVYPKKSEGGVSSILNDDDFSISIHGEIANVRYNTNSSSPAKLSVYSTTGQMKYNDVITSECGINEYQFNTKFFATGLYIVVIEQGGKSIAKKFIIR